MLKQACIPLSLEHQSLLSALWKPLCITYDLKFAEYSFANNFFFRKQHQFSFVQSDPPCVKGVFKSGHPYFIPTCRLEMLHLKKIQLDDDAVIFPVPELWLESLRNCAHPAAISTRANADYIFTVEKLRTLPGQALSSRRNLLSQLLSHHDMESRPLTAHNMNDALVVLEQWQEHLSGPKEESDYWPCRDAFLYLDRFELFGRIAYADGKPVGFTIGELLTPTTALMLFAKSIHAYKGLTPYLYQDFALHLPTSVKWINLEQDLGIPALRQAKEAYAPDMLLDKYQVGCTK